MWGFLSRLHLNHTCGPVFSSSHIHWSSECKNRFLSKTSWVEDIHSAYHCGFVHQRQIVNSPRNSSDLSIDLNEDFVDNWSHVLASRDSVAEYNLTWDGIFSQKELLQFIIEVVPSFLSWQQQDNSLNIAVQLALDLSFPCLCIHSSFHWENSRLGALIAKLLQDVIHSGCELLCNLGISVSMENSPYLKCWLFIHFILDLSINVSSTLFNVKGVPLSARFWAHDHVSSLELVAFQGCWVIFEFEVPQLLLLNAFGIAIEDFKQVSALCDLLISIGVNNFW